MAHHLNDSQILKGLLLGGVMGAAAVLLLAPRPGQQLIHDLSKSAERKLPKNAKKFISDTLLGALIGLLIATRARKRLNRSLSDLYEEVGDKTSSIVNEFYEKGEDFAEGIREHTVNSTEKTLDFIDAILAEVNVWSNLVEAAAEKASVIANKMKDNKRHHHELDQITKWSNHTLDVVRSVRDKVQGWADSAREILQKNPDQDAIHDIIGWILQGVNQWKKGI